MKIDHFKYKPLDYLVKHKQLKDIPNQTLLDSMETYQYHKKECLNLMLYMTKNQQRIEAIREASKMYDRAIFDCWNIQEELINRRINDYKTGREKL